MLIHYLFSVLLSALRHLSAKLQAVHNEEHACVVSLDIQDVFYGIHWNIKLQTVQPPSKADGRRFVGKGSFSSHPSHVLTENRSIKTNEIALAEKTITLQRNMDEPRLDRAEDWLEHRINRSCVSTYITE